MSLLAADGAFLTQGGAPRTVRGGGGLRALRVGGTAARTYYGYRRYCDRTTIYNGAPVGTKQQIDF